MSHESNMLTHKSARTAWRGARRAALTAALAIAALAVAASPVPAHGAGLPAVTAHTAHTAQTAANTAVPAKIPPPKGWLHAFAQGFTGSTLNTGIWGTCYPWQPGGCTNYGNVKDLEKEWYLPSQVQVKNGALGLVARREGTWGTDQFGRPKEYMCRSGMVTSYPGFSFRYGFVRVTARLAFGKGLWDALWLAAQDYQWPPEVDILEHWGSQSISRVFLHPVGMPEQEGVRQFPAAGKGWHTFTLSWTRSRLTWWFDGQQVYTTTTGVPQQAMYLIMNLADDDDTQGGCSGSLYVQAVNVWVPKG
jgi:beta-glucanase (GH16 family)